MLTRDDYNDLKLLVVEYCFCLYWLWIATCRNKWIYLKRYNFVFIFSFCLNDRPIIQFGMTYFISPKCGQTGLWISLSYSTAQDSKFHLALLLLPHLIEYHVLGTKSNSFLTVCQERRISYLLPVECEELNSLAKTFSLCHCFYCRRRPRQEAHTEQMTSCRGMRLQKRLFRESWEVSRFKNIK